MKREFSHHAQSVLCKRKCWHQNFSCGDTKRRISLFYLDLCIPLFLSLAKKYKDIGFWNISLMYKYQYNIKPETKESAGAIARPFKPFSRLFPGSATLTYISTWNIQVKMNGENHAEENWGESFSLSCFCLHLSLSLHLSLRKSLLNVELGPENGVEE